MDSKFSSGIRLTNLDDFITPSQECIKPVEIKKDTTTRTGSKIKIEDDGSYVEIDPTGMKNKLSRVDISLTDCLACSGCITTAETVLINQQSHDELLRVFRNKTMENLKLIVVSFSLQPILSLAMEYKLEPEVCLKKLTGLFKRLGANIVLEMGIAEDFALVEEQKEFLKRYKSIHESGDKSNLPMLASTCPGWVCYAEKTKEHLLPNLSSCRSPQQIMGRLVKDILAIDNCVLPQEIYHATLMPCYDKKLEASRKQFTNDGIRDVDCVISPVEVMLLIRDECPQGLANENSVEIDWPWKTITPYRSLHRLEGSGSGGYAHHILNYAKKVLFNYNGEIQFETVTRKSDILLAKHEENGKSLKVAIVTGFRNIQNVVNKMKRGTCDYDYIEIMACPSGCLNGGAQVKGHLKEVEQVFSNLPIRNIEELYEFYNNWLNGFNSEKVCTNLHTTFEAVTYNPNPLTIKW